MTDCYVTECGSPARYRLNMSREDLQRRDLDELVRAASFAVDMYLVDNRHSIRLLSNAETARVTLTAGIGYLLGIGMLTPTPRDRWPDALTMNIPAHLSPDMDEIVRRSLHARGRPEPHLPNPGRDERP